MNTRQKIEEILLNDFGCFDDFTVDKLLNLFSVGNSEADVCPECGYPKFKKTFEDFERCHGCNWTSEGI